MAVQTIQVQIAHLFFDPENPRFAEEFRDQREIFRFLVNDVGIDDLLNSMAASGVIDGDPMIARPADHAGDYYIIEGNRRLAAFKLLNGEKIGDGKPEPVVPEVRPEFVDRLKFAFVQLGWDADQLEAYLGYKHVTAAREWPPESKAKFVVTRCKGDYSEAKLARFAKRLGTNTPTLRRWLVAYLTIKQAEGLGKFIPEEAYQKRYFGTFYTLLGSEQVQQFLGLERGPVKSDPVPKTHIDQLADLIGWVIGTKATPPIINSRSQQKFDAVLASPSALQYFRSKRNLEGALLYTEFNSGEIAEKLLTAAYTIEECLPKVFDVKEDPKVISAIENLDRAFEKLKLNTQDQASSGKKHGR